MWRARCCVSKARPTPMAIGASAGGASLRRELASLPLKDLRKRAKADGMPAADLEDAMDADDPEELFTSFLVQMHADAAGTRHSLRVSRAVVSLGRRCSVRRWGRHTQPAFRGAEPVTDVAVVLPGWARAGPPAWPDLVRRGVASTSRHVVQWEDGGG